MKNSTLKRIKKAGTLVLLSVIAASCSACGPKDAASPKTTPGAQAPTVNTSAPPSFTNGTLALTPFESSEKHEPNSYRFIRVPYSYGAASPKPELITDRERLVALVGEATASMSRTVQLEGYDDGFFKDRAIVAFTLTFGSGSAKPMVTAVDITGDTITVTANGKMEGDVGTTDMASHLGLLVVEKSGVPKNSKIVIDCGNPGEAFLAE